MRVGIGYDSHRFDPAVRLILGGVHIPDHPGLSGHSDGDAVAHAVIDALLGAAGLGSIGERFPDTDPAYSGADSLELLSTAVRLVTEQGYCVVNVDVTVIAESPKILPHTARMKLALSERLRIDARCVSVKGKRNEGMGWVGRREGLAAIAVVLIDDAGGSTSHHGGARS
ncbi:MAG: 2-C-methyl-D-erythritol 2,4-cyclodiphosphate synthase [Gemmatimonadota bacterium]